MTVEAKTRYAKSGDVNIAYQVVGDGPLDLVLVPGFISHLDLDWAEPELAEIQALFLRAGRVIDDPSLDLPRSLREKIASKLEKSGVTPMRVEKIRRFVPVERAERAGLLGESLPPGLVLDVGLKI